MSGRGIATTAAGIVVVLLFLFAARFRPAIQRVAPFVLTAGVLGAAVYAEVPFERTSTQNKTLVAEPVVDAADMASTTTASTLSTATTSRVPPPATVPPPTTALPPTAVRHSIGDLKGINHSASGTVSVIEAASGAWVLRFENFTVQGVPAPVLYVAEGDDVRDPAGTNLGAFTATKGTTLDVALPDGVEPGDGWTVLVWCEKFATPVANATQHAA